MLNSNIDTEKLAAINDIDRIIHEPARFMVLVYLSVVESADFLFLMNQTGLTSGNLSSHLNKLEAAKYIKIDKMFMNKIPRTTISISPEGRAALEEYVKQMKDVINIL